MIFLIIVIHLKETLPRDFELMGRVSELAGRNLVKKSRSFFLNFLDWSIR
jgi:hypothetical protein